MSANLSKFIHEPDEANPGWHIYRLREPESFAHALGPLRVRLDPVASGTPLTRLRMTPGKGQRNVLDTVHGGAIASLIDIALFAAIRLALKGDGDGAVTLDLSTQFLSAAKVGTPVDAVVEVLRETGRLVFFRGLVEQEGTTCAAFSSTVRKPTRR